MNYENEVKNRIRRKEVVLMAFLDSHDVRNAEILARAGVDILAINLEQNAFAESEIVSIAKAVRDAGCCTLARTSSKDAALLSHYMDLGVDGILATSCAGAEEARLVIDAVKYPPLGQRGLSQLSPAMDYGFPMEGVRLEERLARMNENSMVFVTLETERALLEAGDVAALEQVDSVQIGPTDLAVSMGCAGDLKAERVVSLMRNANAAILAAGNRAGDFLPAPTADKLAELTGRGVYILLIGSDTSLLRQGALAFGQAKKLFTQGE